MLLAGLLHKIDALSFASPKTHPNSAEICHDKELLAVDKMLKHHHNIIYGCKVIVRRDHKKLFHHDTKHTNQQVLCQHLLIDQVYQAEYYEEEMNTRANKLSRLPFDDSSKQETINELYALDTIDPTFNHSQLNLCHIAKLQIDDNELNTFKLKHANKMHGSVYNNSKC